MKKIITIISICLLLFACKKNSKIPTSGGNTTQGVILDSFPLAIGNSWKHYTETHITDSTGAAYSDSYFDDYWKIIADTTINGIVSAKMWQLDSNYNGSTHLGFTYYVNKSDGFYGMAVDNDGSSFFLRKSEEFNYSMLGNFTDSVYADTVFIPATPLKFMHFPSNINDIWISHEYGLNVIKRKWIGFATITTTAGKFDCVKMHAFEDYDNDNQPDSGSFNVYQYFSNKGLIQEEWHSKLIFNSGGWGTLNRISKLTWMNF